MISVGKKKTSAIAWSFAILALVFVLGNLTGLLLPAWQAKLNADITVDFFGRTMGTTYTVKASWGTRTVSQEQVDRVLEKINQQMSTYLPDSELSRFNAAPTLEWFAVSPETAFVTSEALRFHKETAGTLDVTVGPLVKLWDFGPGRHAIGAVLEAPIADALAEAQTKVGGQHLEVRREPPALRKSIAKLEVDLSSIAKGYAVDAVAELLESSGYEGYMIEIGGEVRTRGTRADGKLWRIGIESPAAKKRKIQRVIALDNQALATSGDYRNFRTFHGKKVSHIIKPSSGRPLPFRGWSVTLLADTCLEADALATALLVMGEELGYDWCVEHDVAALFLIREDDQVREVATPQFQARTEKDSAR